jgi:hypothetical protein
MAPVPLFTRSELQAAFGLILPATTAQDAAEQWWEQFADEVDAEGRYLYQDPLVAAGIDPIAPQVIATTKALSSAEQRRNEQLFWGGMSVEDRLELLMRFSSFHFGLVGLISDDLYHRMREAQGLTPEQADVQREQMRHIVAAIRM